MTPPFPHPLHLPLPHLLVLLHLLPFSCQYNLVRRNPLAALGETLVTRQRHACDGDNLSLECPAGTKISLQLVRYGREAPSEQVCPPTQVSPREYTGREGLTCSIPEAVRTVEELCQSKQSCSILTGVTTFGLHTFDPCPGVRKYVEVAYKCRPSSYSSRQLCGGSTLSLSCSRTSHHIAILTAQFQSASQGPIYCPVQAASFLIDSSSDAAEAAMKECEDTQVTSSVVSLCHGRKDCILTASPSTLGAAPCTGLHVYLKTVFACINSSVFLEKFVSQHLENQDIRRDETERRFMPQPRGTESSFVPSNYNMREQNPVEDGVGEQEIEGRGGVIISQRPEDQDMRWRVLSGFFQIHQVLKTQPTRVALVLALTMGVALCTALLCLVGRQCWLATHRPISPRDTPSHLDLDNDAIDYDLACRQLAPLPEPKLMLGGDTREDWTSTLTRTRAKTMSSRLSPLENYLDMEGGTGAHRYSTIGRGVRAREGGSAGLTTPSPPPPCCQGDTPRALAAFHSHSPSDLYY